MSFGLIKLNRGLAMKNIIALFVGMTVFSIAFAMLPALTPEQQTAAGLAKAKTAYGDKVAAFQLCKVQNNLANRFKTAATPAPAACVEPPAFVPPSTTQAAIPPVATNAPAPTTNSSAPTNATGVPAAK